MDGLGVAVVGFGWMGRVHAQAYARVPHHFPSVSPVRLVSVADDVPGRADEAARRYGFEESTRDWRSLVGDPRVGAVSITAPNFLHREIGSAFAAAGQHIWIEKPVGLSAADARAIVGDVQVAVGFNYRNAPAVEKARLLIAEGGIGDVTHARFRFLSDYAAHPDDALSWRFERARGGNGVLGDLGAHGVDLIRYLLGEIDSLVADTAIFIRERPRPTAATAGHERGRGEPGPVENDDYFGSLLRMASGARVILDCSRVAVGEQNSYGFEIHGTRGALFWDFRRMGELGIGTDTQFVGPSDGDFGAFQPGAGIPMGYDDLKVIEAARFLQSVAEGIPYGATLVDAIRAAEALDALEQSAVSGAWITLNP
ncbi:Gfo/Idh/MocA family oxidoreductase [Actinoplanes sp. LDG1-06]|uniref:Gfo/Idh/MocA family oxidoreductase n=1 Tax=Paractinoplanes ovalisporus TaxID=2810368 RepID=A0ABS2AGS6_9ACTN|nr:Gfo/Idh/MocA family oxidoreductase [Actinoplanes ovalisporus]MBM2619029.1 Gfo/Idh/MocA family oxidoreductase [Actinoplanes ovalisporus]